jgi:large subunit ribosomal protein L4
MPSVTVFSAAGAAGSPVSLREDVFGGEPNAPLLHQAVQRQLADRRQGTHDTQTRGEVDRTTKKVWRQKGTGRARQGSRKGPHWSGGGVAFGPHPRSYRQDLPKKMRAAAIRSALASKTAAGELVLIEQLSMEKPSTKQLNQLLGTVIEGQSSILLMLDRPERSVQLSARNLPNVTTATTENVNVYDLLRHKRVVMTVAAARLLEERYAKPGADAASNEAGGAAEGGTGTTATKRASRKTAAPADAAPTEE